jgi:hypothetical protein
MAAGNWIMFDAAKAKIGDGTFDMNSHTFKVQLHTNSYTPNRATQAVRADLTNELSTANGYTAGGLALSSLTFNQSGGTAAFDAADPAWTASGGNIGPFRIAVIYDDTAASDDLVCYCILDSADITITDTQTGTIVLNASGILTLSGATS